MLIVSRRNTESILIEPAADIDPATTTLQDVFGDGPIQITIFSGASQRVKMGVNAPRALSIWRKDKPD